MTELKAIKIHYAWLDDMPDRYVVVYLRDNLADSALPFVSIAVHDDDVWQSEEGIDNKQPSEPMAIAKAQVEAMEIARKALVYDIFIVRSSAFKLGA